MFLVSNYPFLTESCLDSIMASTPLRGRSAKVRNRERLDPADCAKDNDFTAPTCTPGSSLDSSEDSRESESDLLEELILLF